MIPRGYETTVTYIEDPVGWWRRKAYECLRLLVSEREEKGTGPGTDGYWCARYGIQEHELARLRSEIKGAKTDLRTEYAKRKLAEGRNKRLHGRVRLLQSQIADHLLLQGQQGQRRVWDRKIKGEFVEHIEPKKPEKPMPRRKPAPRKLPTAPGLYWIRGQGYQEWRLIELQHVRQADGAVGMQQRAHASPAHIPFCEIRGNWYWSGPVVPPVK